MPIEEACALFLHYGKLNAISASLKVLLYLLPPPAAITTNCLPVVFPLKVIGVACPLAGSFVIQSSLPVSLSNARKRLSFVAAMKTRPPAVTIEPPRFGDPVGEMPRFSRSSTTPSGTCQRSLPVFRSTELSVPQGGF